MNRRLWQVLGHAWRVGSLRPAVFGLLDTVAVGPLRSVWATQAPWYAGKYVERRGGLIRLDDCVMDVRPTVFSTFQRGCLWLHRHEEPERIAVARFVDPRLPVVELGASTGMLSCLINRRLKDPTAHVAVEANPDLIPIILANRRLNDARFSVVHAALAYDTDKSAFSVGGDHLEGRVGMNRDSTRDIDVVNLERLLEPRSATPVTLVCDIEGMELDLWRHEQDVIARRVEWLIIEMHDEICGIERVEQMKHELAERGFRTVWERSWTRVFHRAG